MLQRSPQEAPNAAALCKEENRTDWRAALFVALATALALILISVPIVAGFGGAFAIDAESDGYPTNSAAQTVASPPPAEYPEVFSPGLNSIDASYCQHIRAAVAPESALLIDAITDAENTIVAASGFDVVIDDGPKWEYMLTKSGAGKLADLVALANGRRDVFEIQECRSQKSEETIQVVKSATASDVREIEDVIAAVNGDIAAYRTGAKRMTLSDQRGRHIE